MNRCAEAEYAAMDPEFAADLRTPEQTAPAHRFPHRWCAPLATAERAMKSDTVEIVGMVTILLSALQLGWLLLVVLS